MGKTEFEAIYYGGPADGLEATIVSNKNGLPPGVSGLEKYHLVNVTTPLWNYFVNNSMVENARIGVYRLEDEPDYYNADYDILKYNFVEIVDYDDFLEKYREN